MFVLVVVCDLKLAGGFILVHYQVSLALFLFFMCHRSPRHAAYVTVVSFIARREVFLQNFWHYYELSISTLCFCLS